MNATFKKKENQLKHQSPNPFSSTMDSMETQLLYACVDGNYDLVTNILSRDIELIHCCSPTKVSCLHYACNNRDAVMVKLLLEAGANVNAADWAGLTPLHYLVSQRFTFHYPKLFNIDKLKHIMDILFEAGAEIDAMSPLHGTPLTMAFVGQSVEAVRDLLNIGADMYLAMHFKHADKIIERIISKNNKLRLLVDEFANAGWSIKSIDDDKTTSYHFE